MPLGELPLGDINVNAIETMSAGQKRDAQQKGGGQMAAARKMRRRNASAVDDQSAHYAMNVQMVDEGVRRINNENMAQ